MKNNQLNQSNQSSNSPNLNNNLRKQGKKAGRVFLFLLITLALFGCASDTTGASGGDITPQAPKVLKLINVFNVSDDSSLELDAINSLHLANIGGNTYLFTTSQDDNGISVFSVSDNGSLVNVTNVSDDTTLNLELSEGSATAVVGGTNYLFVAGGSDNGISVFSVAGDGSLDNTTNVNDGGSLELDGAGWPATAVVGGTNYLFVAGGVDDGVSVFSIADNGSLNNVFNIDDGSDDSLELDAVITPHVATVGGTTYLFTTGQVDDGISVFSIADNGSLANVTNVSDNSILKLNGAISPTTAVVGGTNYLFVAGGADNGISVFSVEGNGSLANITNVSDNATLNLRGASAVTTAEIGGTTYVFVTGGIDDGFSVFSVGDDGSLANVANVSDGGNLELDNANAITTAEVGGSTYVFVAGFTDDGVSVFRAELK